MERPSPGRVHESPPSFNSYIDVYISSFFTKGQEFLRGGWVGVFFRGLVYDFCLSEMLGSWECMEISYHQNGLVTTRWGPLSVLSRGP